jgi:hypothetical protein
MQPIVRRSLLSIAATVILGLLLAAVPTAAGAAPTGNPVGGCPSPQFELMTVKQVQKQARKEFWDAIAAADRNADNYLCVKASDVGGTYTDNNAPL